MQFMDFLIKEMKLIQLSPLGKLSYVYYLIAFRDNIWIFDEEDLHTNRVDLKPIHDQITSRKVNATRPSNTTYWTSILQNVGDSLIAQYDPKKKTLNIQNEISENSPLVRKVVKKLNINKVYFKGIEYNFSEKELYHGTCSSKLPGIMKFGLTPNEKSNFGDETQSIIKDTIFLTDMYERAESFAIRCAMFSGSEPVVLKVKIPDPSLLVPDYDIDRRADANTYAHSRKAYLEPTYSGDSMKASRHAGIYGYRGRIPAKFIEKIN